MTIQSLHQLVWKRFVRLPYGHVLDYTDPSGEVIYPTAEECAKAMPNAFGWWTPIENGAFFTGIYLWALLEQYERAPDLKTADEIQVLKNGLFLLQDVARVEGFIARGVGEDGRSHYPISSEDQFTPFVLALYRYYQSSLCKEQEQVKSRLLRALRALRANRWSHPCDVEGLCFCSWESNASWRGVCKLLFCARVIYELTGEVEDLQDYHRLAAARPGDSIFTRLEIASQGYAHDLVASLGAKQNWICTCAHLGLGELVKMDGENACYFKQGLRNNGITTLGIVGDIKKYDNAKEGFDINWRRLAPLWQDYENNVGKALSVAYAQSELWQKDVVPHRRMEHWLLGNALFSSLIALTCGDEAIAAKAKDLLSSCISHVEWDSLHLSYAFVAEAALIVSKGE